MGKIKTEGIGEVQEFVDIVRIFLLLPTLILKLLICRV